MSAAAHPVLGRTKPWPMALLYPDDFDIGFEEYSTPTMYGLARVVGRTIDILALDARHPGRGDGGRFIEACQAKYKRVRILFIGNPLLKGMLGRRGFVPYRLYEAGEWIEGMEWKAQ